MIKHISRLFTALIMAISVKQVYAVGDLPGGPAVNQLTFQTPVTSVARDLWSLHNMMLIVCLLIFIGVFGVMLYSIIVHRKSRGAKPANFHESTTVEIIWTVVPFIILIMMALPATKAVIAMKDTSDADLTVKVTGYQWKWGYEYLKGPGEGIRFLSTLSTPREQIEGLQPITRTYLQEVDHPLVVPVNKKVRIITTAADVIHSWYVPAFGVKQDAIPGFTRDTWFKAEKIGMYHGFCTELCGRDHAFMPVVVNVVSEEDFDRWVSAQRNLSNDKTDNRERSYTREELINIGKDIYTANCQACHQANGKGVGPFPTLVNAPLVTGPEVEQIKLVLHGKSLMPAWNKSLNDVQIAGVINYQRNSWGNSNTHTLQPADVATVRKGKPLPEADKSGTTDLEAVPKMIARG